MTASIVSDGLRRNVSYGEQGEEHVVSDNLSEEIVLTCPIAEFYMPAIGRLYREVVVVIVDNDNVDVDRYGRIPLPQLHPFQYISAVVILASLLLQSVQAIRSKSKTP